MLKIGQTNVPSRITLILSLDFPTLDKISSNLGDKKKLTGCKLLTDGTTRWNMRVETTWKIFSKYIFILVGFITKDRYTLDTFAVGISIKRYCN